MRTFLGAVGRVLVTGGILILLFVAYQLWGTGLHEARAQNALEDEFASVVVTPGAAVVEVEEDELASAWRDAWNCCSSSFCARAWRTPGPQSW